jgi:hypothetical protein
MSKRVAQWILGMILVLFVVLGMAYAFTTPTLEAPDEIHHYSYIRSLVDTGSPPGTKDGEKSFSNHAPLYYVIGALGSFWMPGVRATTRTLAIDSATWDGITRTSISIPTRIASAPAIPGWASGLCG